MYEFIMTIFCLATMGFTVCLIISRIVPWLMDIKYINQNSLIKNINKFAMIIIVSFIALFAISFILFYGFKSIAMLLEGSTYTHSTDLGDSIWWGKTITVILKFSFVLSLFSAFIPQAKEIYGSVQANKTGFKKYIIINLFIIAIAILLGSLLKKIEVFFIFVYLYVYRICDFPYQNSAYKSNKLVIKRIEKVNVKIEEAIKEISTTINNIGNMETYTKTYNCTLKMLIRKLKKFRKTMTIEPMVFQEDTCVYNIINLLKTLHYEKEILMSYKKYKQNLEKEREFAFPRYAKKCDTKEFCLSNFRDLKQDLSCVLKNNQNDILKLGNYHKETNLYEKYRIKTL